MRSAHARTRASCQIAALRAGSEAGCTAPRALRRGRGRAAARHRRPVRRSVVRPPLPEGRRSAAKLRRTRWKKWKTSCSDLSRYPEQSGDRMNEDKFSAMPDLPQGGQNGNESQESQLCAHTRRVTTSRDEAMWRPGIRNRPAREGTWGECGLRGTGVAHWGCPPGGGHPHASGDWAVSVARGRRVVRRRRRRRHGNLLLLLDGRRPHGWAGSPRTACGGSPSGCAGGCS